MDYIKMKTLQKLINKIFHKCKPLIGLCHNCLKSNVKIENRKLIFCQTCSQTFIKGSWKLK